MALDNQHRDFARSRATGIRPPGRHYERGRPAYPSEAAAWLSAQVGLGPGRTVVDVGAGTGKLTRALLDSGATVLAMEPVAAMREVLERHLPRATALDGVAESMPLGDSAVDAVVVGQAFHWFDGPASLAEFHRVLRPGGRLGLIWNIRDRRQPLQRAIDEITEPLRGTTPAVGRGTWRTAFDRSALFSPCGEHRVAFELMLDHNTFVDRIGSVSFIAALDEPHREQVLDRVRRLASEHLEPWSYVTEIYVYERVEDFPAATRASTATLIHVSREDPDTEELRAEQLARERAERELAQDPPQEEETAQHERRADKAKYLREKLEERAESEQAVSDSDAAEDD